MYHILQVSLGTVNKDLSYLREMAHQNLQKHIQQKLPEEYQRCLIGMNQVLKLSWHIANSSRQNGQDHNDNYSNILTTCNDRTRLQALALINDSYKYKMDLMTNGVSVTDAIRFVQTYKEKLTTMYAKGGNSKENEESGYNDDKDQIEEKQEEETGEIKQETTNQVF
jgi:vacuolar-type H+-ATPase catalytic subunit A/Vma1